MLRLLAFLLLLSQASLAAPPGAAAPAAEPQIQSDLLAAARAAVETHGDGGTERLVVVDYSKHSRDERLFVVDLSSGPVSAYRAAHGKGSDPDHDSHLDRFSSVSGSNASPQGAFRVAERYTGKHGRSLRLDGLDPANRNARDRAIVVHAASYAEPAFLERYGKLGRSNGCIVLSSTDFARFFDQVPKGTLIYVGK